MTIILECEYDPPHTHEYPDDWVFGGPRGRDPRSDPRWIPTTYLYLNARLESVWLTQTPLCLDQALDDFTRWGGDGAVYVQAKHPGQVFELLDYQYDRGTDTVFPLGA